MDKPVTQTAGKDERRREPRQMLTTDATVTIEGRAHAARDWSESGFLIDGYEGGLAAGDRTDIRMSVPLDDGAFDLACQAIVVRIDAATKTLAAAFARMDRETRVALQGHFRGVEAADRTADPD